MTHECVSCAACCSVLTVRLEHLFPDGLVSGDSAREYYRAFLGVEKLEGLVHFPMRCRQLDEGDRCMIYESRPKVCREFDCGWDGRAS